MRSLKTILLAGLVSLLPIKHISAQSQNKEPIQIKGNQCLEWIADGVGDQNAEVDSLEEDYIRKKFKESDILYVCTQLSSEFGPKMAKIYNTLEDALNYKEENIRWPPQEIISFNKKGKIIAAYEIAEGVQPLDIPKINYARKMSKRYKTYMEELK